MNPQTTSRDERSADGAPLVDALIQAVKMERDEFHERCNNSYSTEALVLAKERVALCKRALLDAMRRSGEVICDEPSAAEQEAMGVRP